MDRDGQILRSWQDHGLFVGSWSPTWKVRRHKKRVWNQWRRDEECIVWVQYTARSIQLCLVYNALVLLPVTVDVANQQIHVEVSQAVYMWYTVRSLPSQPRGAVSEYLHRCGIVLVALNLQLWHHCINPAALLTVEAPCTPQMLWNVALETLETLETTSCLGWGLLLGTTQVVVTVTWTLVWLEFYSLWLQIKDVIMYSWTVLMQALTPAAHIPAVL